MLNRVRDAVIARLNEAGFSACAAFPKRSVPMFESAVCVSILRAESSGRSGFLGMKQIAGQDPAEVYGMLCSLTLGLDFYVPLTERDAAGKCAELFDQAVESLNGTETAMGIRLKALRCGEAKPDSVSGMMHLRGEAEGRALLTLSGEDSEGGKFLDFVLKGELNT